MESAGGTTLEQSSLDTWRLGQGCVLDGQAMAGSWHRAKRDGSMFGERSWCTRLLGTCTHGEISLAGSMKTWRDTGAIDGREL
jgi:hypothetical protein